VVDFSTISAAAPSHAPGAVTVTVINPDDQSGAVASGFTYTEGQDVQPCATAHRLEGTWLAGNGQEVEITQVGCEVIGTYLPTRTCTASGPTIGPPGPGDPVTSTMFRAQVQGDRLVGQLAACIFQEGPAARRWQMQPMEMTIRPDDKLASGTWEDTNGDRLPVSATWVRDTVTVHCQMPSVTAGCVKIGGGNVFFYQVWFCPVSACSPRLCSADTLGTMGRCVFTKSEVQNFLAAGKGKILEGQLPPD
jgi:hypothetical protein